MENKTETQALEENVERKSRKNIKIGAILGYVGFAINILYGLFFTPWILEVVGDSSYGVYTVAMSVINLFLLDFGLSTTTNAYLAKYRATHDEASANRYCGVVLKTYLILDAILAAVFLTLFFTLEFIYQGLSPEEVTSLKGVFLIVALFSLVSFPSTIFKGVLESHEEFAFLKAVTIGEKLLTTALSAGALLLGFGIYGVVGSHAICGTVSVILHIVFARKKTPIRLNFKEKMDWAFLKPIFSFSIFSFLVSIGSRFVFTISPTVLGIVSNSAEAGMFGVASQIEGYIYTFGAILSGFFIPSIARINELGGESPAKLQELAVKIGKIQLFFIGLILVGFASCGEEFVTLWLRKTDYDRETIYYLILLVSAYQLLFVPESIFWTAMLTKKEGVKALAVFSLTRAAVNVIVGFVLSYFFGALGMCLSICAVRLLGVIAENLLYKRVLKISPLPFFGKVFPKALPALLVSLGAGLALHFFLPLDTLPRFLVIGFTVVILYVLLYLPNLPKGWKDMLFHRKETDSAQGKEG